MIDHERLEEKGRETDLVFDFHSESYNDKIQ